MLDQMNHFLRAHRVTDVQKSLVVSSGVNYWSFCITYLPMPNKDEKMPGTKKGKVDYREVLEEHIFARFAEMRKIRREIAAAESIPPFAVFTDAELAELAKLEEMSLKNMKNIPGIGERKIEKYGPRFCLMPNEESRESDGEDS